MKGGDGDRGSEQDCEAGEAHDVWELEGAGILRAVTWTEVYSCHRQVRDTKGPEDRLILDLLLRNLNFM